MPKLTDEVALVTGGTKGIGRAIAKQFAAEGAKVVAIGRTEELGRSLEREILDSGGEARFVATDVGVESEVASAVQAAVDTYGALSVLVNNAAPTELLPRLDGPVDQIGFEAWEQVIHLSLNSVFLCCKHALPEMVKAGHGAVVNISSGASVRGMQGMAGYTAAKAAMNGLTRSIAVDYGPQGVRCNALIVGFVMSDPRMAAFLAGHPALSEYLEQRPIARPGTPEDIAHAATYLASRESSYVTGAFLTIDGGASCKADVPRLSDGAVPEPAGS